MTGITYFVSRSFGNEYDAGVDSEKPVIYGLELIRDNWEVIDDFVTINRKGETQFSFGKGDEGDYEFSDLNELANALLTHYRKFSFSLLTCDLEIKTGGIVPDTSGIHFNDMNNRHYVLGRFQYQMSEKEMLELYNLLYQGLRSDKVKQVEASKADDAVAK